MRRISIGLAALGLAVVIGAPLHGATAEEDAASSRLVPGGYLQPRRVPDADPSPVLRSGLPRPRAAEPSPEPAATGSGSGSAALGLGRPDLMTGAGSASGTRRG